MKAGLKEWVILNRTILIVLNAKTIQKEHFETS